MDHLNDKANYSVPSENYLRRQVEKNELVFGEKRDAYVFFVIVAIK